MTEDTMSIGIDYAGYEHVLDKRRQRIVVLDSRGIVNQLDLDGTPVNTTDDWYEHVYRRRREAADCPDEDEHCGGWRETIHTRVMGSIEKTFA